MATTATAGEVRYLRWSMRDLLQGWRVNIQGTGTVSMAAQCLRAGEVGRRLLLVEEEVVTLRLEGVTLRHR